MTERIEIEQAIVAEHEKLVGGVIDTIVVEDDGDDFWPGFSVSFPDGRDPLLVVVSRDPEGNGPGHLFIGPPE